MAPISTDLMGWAATAQPEAAFLSLLTLFVLSIALLVLCASCKKHSFELESTPTEPKSSTLVSVARMEDSRAKDNPAVNQITNDEIGGFGQSNAELSQGGVTYKAWRSHTLTPGSSLSTQVNGSAGTIDNTATL